MRHIRGFSLLCLALVRFCDYCSGSDTFFGSAPTTATRTSSVRGGSSSRSIIANNNDAAGRGLDEVTTTSSSAVVGDLSKKQGAYGKVPMHKESTLSQLCRLDEVWAALTLLYLKPLRSNLDSPWIQKQFPQTQDLTFANEMLVKVSRSFAAVIQQLPSTLLVDVLVFYLVLRALDTIEDDTSIPHATKIPMLQSFEKSALRESPNWNLDGVGSGDERTLLQQFDKVQRVYHCLAAPSRQVIADITRRMASGMAEFVDKDLGQGTTDVEQYNRYCHIVAGLVGEGLSRLFASSGLEDASFAKETHLSNQMGLFLQKTNIIRDYLEDYVDGRAFWPQTVWGLYSETGDLGYFTNQTDPIVQTKSLQCLNALVTDALELVPDCLVYLSRLRCNEVFRFCAIPQVMAIATLEKCYNNPRVFTGVVKIRRGLSCRLIVRTHTLAQVHESFYVFARRIRSQVPQSGDPTAERTRASCDAVMRATRDLAVRTQRVRLWRGLALVAMVAAVANAGPIPQIVLGVLGLILGILSLVEERSLQSVTLRNRSSPVAAGLPTMDNEVGRVAA